MAAPSVPQEICRRLNDKIQDLKGNVRVCCRVRPMLPNEHETITLQDGTSAPILAFPTGAAAPVELTMLGRAVLKVGSPPTLHSLVLARPRVRSSS